MQGTEEVLRQKTAAKEASLLEQRLLAVCTALGSVLADTRANVEKKQARTYEELKAEQEEQEQVPCPSHQPPQALKPCYLPSHPRHQIQTGLWLETLPTCFLVCCGVPRQYHDNCKLQ